MRLFFIMKFKIKKVPDGFVDNPLLAVRKVSNLNFILVSIDNLMTICVCIVTGFLQKKFGPKKVEGHLNPGLFNPKLQPRTFQSQTFQP